MAGKWNRKFKQADINRIKSLTLAEKAVLNYYIFRQGQNKDAWPSRSTVAADLGMHGTTVSAHLRLLVEAGYLIKIGQRDWRGSTHYQVVDQLPEDTPESRAKLSELRKAHKWWKSRQLSFGWGVSSPERFRSSKRSGSAQGQRSGSAQVSGAVPLRESIIEGCQSEASEAVASSASECKHTQNLADSQSAASPPPAAASGVCVELEDKTKTQTHDCSCKKLSTICDRHYRLKLPTLATPDSEILSACSASALYPDHPTLVQFLDQIATINPITLLGEPGIGKTTLARVLLGAPAEVRGSKIISDQWNNEKTVDPRTGEPSTKNDQLFGMISDDVPTLFDDVLNSIPTNQKKREQLVSALCGRLDEASSPTAFTANKTFAEIEKEAPALASRLKDGIIIEVESDEHRGVRRAISGMQAAVR